jgi:DNA-binding NarL/FixJ family response regulator
MGYLDLTPREKDVLKSLASGKSRLGIALELGISQNNVNTRLDAVFSKTNVTKEDCPALAAILWWVDHYGLPLKYSVDAKLSTKQLQILECLVKDKGRSHIGKKLFMSQRTVERHFSQIYSFLGVSQNRTNYPLICASLWFLTVHR